MENNNKIIKIVFSEECEKNALRFDEFENSIINTINDYSNASFYVFLRNPMPQSELDSVVKELCEKIESIHGNSVTFSRNNECFGEKEHQGVFISGLVSAIYYIEIR